MIERMHAWLENLKFPRLLIFTAMLFLADLVVPDLIPFADELLLAGVTLLLARIRKTPEDRTQESRPGDA